MDQKVCCFNQDLSMETSFTFHEAEGVERLASIAAGLALLS